MNADDRDRLRRILASFDEAGLVALSNKGLVRRAQKDLEAGDLEHEETDTAVVVRGPGWVVTMPPDGPAHAADDTKASGVTRRILAATIYLRNHWAAAPGADSPGSPDAARLADGLLGLELDHLEKWAGKTLVREALALVRGGMEIEVEAHTVLTIRLIRHEVEARLPPVVGKKSARALLDEVLTTAPKSLHKRWVVVAVLAFQQSRGRVLERPADAASPEEAGAPRSRSQVAAAARELLEGMTATGLAHPSERMVERLFTLSVSAMAVHLPRLNRLLRTIADEVDRVLNRDAAADTGRLFDQACRTYALATALAAAGPQPPVTLAGRHRTQYDPVGDLRLAGLGAHPWRTASGYEGLTVLLWDRDGKRFLTWTASRPVGGPDRFSAAKAYRGEVAVGRRRCAGTVQPLGIHPVPGPSQPAWTPFRVAKDFRGRAWPRSIRPASTSPAGPSTTGGALHAYALTQYPIGLTEKDPIDRIVVLRPSQWADRFFDEMRQQLCWRLRDAAGNVLTLTLPWAGVYEDAVAFLEAVNPARDELTGVVARLGFGGRGVLIEPLSLLSRGGPHGQRVLNPAFDRGLIASRQSGLLEQLRQKYGRDRIATVLSADDEDGDEEAGGLEGAPAGIQARLAEAVRELLRVAESGVGRMDESFRERFRRLSAELERAGLQELGAGLTALGRAEAAASAILWNGYLGRLHRESVRLALSGLSGERMNEE